MTSALRRVSLGTLAVATLFASSARAQDGKPVDVTPYLMSRDSEIALARTAAPPSISDSATVLVFDGKTYVEGAHGTNGFVCLVARAFSDPLNDPDRWNVKTSAPHCFNPAAARTVMLPLIKQTEWMIQGVSAKAILARFDKGFANHTFARAAPGAMAYMLSPRQVLAAENTHWLPHVMFFYDKSMKESQWGAKESGTPMIDGSAPDAHPNYFLLIIPVRKWSDGTSAM